MVQDTTQFDWEKETRAIAAKVAKTPRLTKEEVMKAMPNEQLAELIEKHGANYVILNKAGTTWVQDPGSSLPFFTPLKLRAEQVAKETGGVVVTLSEAIMIVAKNAK